MVVRGIKDFFRANHHLGAGDIFGGKHMVAYEVK